MKMGIIQRYFVMAILASTIFYYHSTDSVAQVKVLDDVVADCALTPALKDSKYYPNKDNMNLANNLRRETGSGWVGKGEPIYIVGRVLDEDCLPVDSATVEMWQANAFGRYSHPRDQSKKQRDEHFLGSGRYRTDNLGQFHFLSVLPGKSSDGDEPKVHFRVSHNDFDAFETVMYFSEQARVQNPDFKKLLGQKELVTASRVLTTAPNRQRQEIDENDAVYQFVITLKGQTRFKMY